jgi:hypothetical protein
MVFLHSLNIIQLFLEHLISHGDAALSSISPEVVLMTPHH